MKYVIVGASYAAVGAVEEIRSIDSDGEILIVSDEPYRIDTVAALAAGGVNREQYCGGAVQRSGHVFAKVVFDNQRAIPERLRQIGVKSACIKRCG